MQLCHPQSHCIHGNLKRKVIHHIIIVIPYQMVHDQLLRVKTEKKMTVPSSHKSQKKIRGEKLSAKVISDMGIIKKFTLLGIRKWLTASIISNILPTGQLQASVHGTCEVTVNNKGSKTVNCKNQLSVNILHFNKK